MEEIFRKSCPIDQKLGKTGNNFCIIKRGSSFPLGEFYNIISLKRMSVSKPVTNYAAKMFDQMSKNSEKTDFFINSNKSFS